METLNASEVKVIANTSGYGGWLILGGIDLDKERWKKFEVSTSSLSGGKLEVLMDDLELVGKRIVMISITVQGNV